MQIAKSSKTRTAHRIRPRYLNHRLLTIYLLTTKAHKVHINKYDPAITATP